MTSLTEFDTTEITAVVVVFFFCFRPFSVDLNLMIRVDKSCFALQSINTINVMQALSATRAEEVQCSLDGGIVLQLNVRVQGQSSEA